MNAKTLPSGEMAPDRSVPLYPAKLRIEASAPSENSDRARCPIHHPAARLRAITAAVNANALDLRDRGAPAAPMLGSDFASQAVLNRRRSSSRSPACW